MQWRTTAAAGAWRGGRLSWRGAGEGTPRASLRTLAVGQSRSGCSDGRLWPWARRSAAQLEGRILAARLTSTAAGACVAREKKVDCARALV